MHHVDLTGLRVAVLAADGAEQVEITSPVEALQDHGAEVEIVSLRPGRLRTVNFLYPGKKVRVNRTLRTADADLYDALLIPGGLIGPDTLRQSEQALDFVRAFDNAGKPIAVICHGPWLLASAGLLVRRNLTSWPGIRDDVRNAGGVWHDEPVVRDRNWVSSRGPHDLRHFNRAMLELFAARVPVPPAQPEYSETPPAPRPRRERRAPVARMLGGGVLVAGITYLVVQQLRRESETELEYVEVVDLEPATVDVHPADDYGDDDALAGGFAGGMPYREGGPEYTAGGTGYLGHDGTLTTSGAAAGTGMGAPGIGGTGGYATSAGGSTMGSGVGDAGPGSTGGGFGASGAGMRGGMDDDVTLAGPGTGGYGASAGGALGGASAGGFGAPDSGVGMSTGGGMTDASRGTTGAYGSNLGDTAIGMPRGTDDAGGGGDNRGGTGTGGYGG